VIREQSRSIILIDSIVQPLQRQYQDQDQFQQQQQVKPSQ